MGKICGIPRARGAKRIRYRSQLSVTCLCHLRAFNETIPLIRIRFPHLMKTRVAL